MTKLKGGYIAADFSDLDFGRLDDNDYVKTLTKDRKLDFLNTLKKCVELKKPLLINISYYDVPLNQLVSPYISDDLIYYGFNFTYMSYIFNIEVDISMTDLDIYVRSRNIMNITD